MDQDAVSRLAADVLEYAYRLDKDNLEAVAHALGRESWHSMTADLTFEAYDAGHGMGILGADLAVPDTHLSLTDGEIGFPKAEAPSTFTVAVLDQDWEGEVYWVSAMDGTVTQRGGRLLEEGRVPVIGASPLA